jgi:hypothetical protein
VGEVVNGFGREIVWNLHVMAPGEQDVGEVRTDETGSPGDEAAHP